MVVVVVLVFDVFMLCPFLKHLTLIWFGASWFSHFAPVLAGNYLKVRPMYQHIYYIIVD
ncbi:MAG: hypothetical protein J6W71_05815 [Methanobrevibacter sp.]|nr:hypothetical protein [Methanobrevibacter sp.]